MNKPLCSIKIIFVWLFLLLAPQPFLVGNIAKNNASCFVLRPGYPNAGLFATCHRVLRLLECYKLGWCSGIEVDFSNEGCYYDKKLGNNWWNYYFEPIKYGSTTPKKEIRKNIRFMQPGPSAILVPHKRIKWYVKNYIIPKKHIQQKVDAFISREFKNHFMIGVHYRGTDKITSHEAKRISYEKVRYIVQQVITKRQNNTTDYRLFIATDEQAFLNFMIQSFGTKVCFNPNVIRSTTDKPLHQNHKMQSPYASGEGAVVDCLLLSKTNFLIRTKSNLSQWATFFNQKIPCICL